MKNSTVKNLGNNYYLLNGVIQHRFSTAYYDLKTKKGNIEPSAWLIKRAEKNI